ncbi:MAG: DUF5686 family protein, partial [Cyclobacteriaceae bacterium]|nr:DUF5686 family protein [Cyclobacteriaceae bacterium]
ASFQEYNFYENWLSIVEKEFVSPIADGWKASYDYYLLDSLYLGNDYCYKIDFSPKRDQDLAFSGTMWITKKEYALKQIDATVPKRANLNYIEKIKIQQELTSTATGPWIPLKTRVLLDVSEISKKSPGMLAKFYVSNKDIQTNINRPNSFYEVPVEMEEGIQDADEEYWAEHRHDSLTATEMNVYNMIDTLSNLPSVKTYLEIAKFLVNTYIPVGIFDIGPYTGMYGFNDIEGLRLGFGLRTNLKFSNKWVLGGIVGYGFKDDRWKYDLGVKYIVSRNPWTTISYKHKFDIDPIWLLTGERGPESLFYAYTRFGTLVDPFAHTLNMLKFETQLGTGLMGTVILKHQTFIPESDFQYIKNPNTALSELRTSFTTTEGNFELRYAKDELFIINDNERLSMGTNRYPVLTLRYTLGLKDVLGSDFNYHKLSGSIKKSQKMGVFGVSDLSLSGQYIFSQLPYPLLNSHIGNETPFYVSFANNLMNYYEFTSDHHVSFRMRHHFEGLILNRIPLMKRLKWRLTGTADVVYGGIRQENMDMVVDRIDNLGNPYFPFQTFDSRPYMELGYGVENIFKVLRVDFFHRLTYLDRADVNPFGVKFSFQFIL